MANHSATKKAIRKTITKTAINKSRKTRIRTYIKKVLTAVESGLEQEANKALTEAQSEIMRGVSCNLIKKNNASRKISRLASKVKSVSKTNLQLAKKVEPSKIKVASVSGKKTGVQKTVKKISSKKITKTTTENKKTK